MKRRIVLCIAVSLCAGVYAGNNPGIYKKGWIDFNKNGVKDIYEDPSAPIEARVQDLLSQMTLEEKTCQMATLYGSGRVLKDSLPTDFAMTGPPCSLPNADRGLPGIRN